MYQYLAVDRIPKQLQAGFVYHNIDFELAGLLCPCGCGHAITLLVPDSHQLSLSHGKLTIEPSIAVCDAPCKSHFYIHEGQVDWMLAFSAAEASAVMRSQMVRHASNAPRPASWLFRFGRLVLRATVRIGKFLGW
jgi:hypothetical protein